MKIVIGFFILYIIIGIGFVNPDCERAKKDKNGKCYGDIYESKKCIMCNKRFNDE